MSRVRCVTNQRTRIRSPGAVSVLGQRYRWWASITSAVGRRLVFAGYQPILQTHIEWPVTTLVICHLCMICIYNLNWMRHYEDLLLLLLPPHHIHAQCTNGKYKKTCARFGMAYAKLPSLFTYIYELLIYRLTHRHFKSHYLYKHWCAMYHHTTKSRNVFIHFC